MKEKKDNIIFESGAEYGYSPHERIDKLDEKLERRFDKFEDKTLTDKATLLTVFGIFASIVTFLSLEVQILKTVCSFGKIFGLSLIFLSVLLIFNVLLHYIAQTWINSKNKYFPLAIFIFSISLFLIGTIASAFGNENKCNNTVASDENTCKNYDYLENKYFFYLNDRIDHFYEIIKENQECQ